MITTSDSPIITFTNNNTGDWTVYDLLDSQWEHVYPYSAGSYFVPLWIENQYCCVDSSELIIQIKGDEVFYIPNTFTPDGDEHNHYFQPIFTAGYYPPNFQIEI